ncbi:helix-turn-helix domain-containing protein [Chthonobacter rhizosphaerae]|uniref:helix-turn-helix domain-containing protein n=1 Tax=Chthonobacter rhizosphaerae TaxID=2735553 RepID=UPI0015EF8206|nr:helix-turn-helix domain-containing protein [Chthonobacter rhizosphaerae]
MAGVFDLDIPPGQKLVLLALADCADDMGRCWPSQKKLAEKTSFVLRTVQSHLEWLTEQGFLQRKHRSNRSGYRTSDEYQINLRANSACRDEGLRANSACDQVQNLHVYIDETSIETSVLCIDKEFEELWKSFPLKKGRKEADAAYRKARKRTPFDQIKTGLQAYIVSKPDWQQWKMLSSWLNAERWTDEYAPPPKKEARQAVNREDELNKAMGIVE